MKIKKITKKEPEFTVDIEVENTHTYQLENGIISHNTTSAFNGTSSGIHPAHSPYYIRYVRNSMKDPLSVFMVNKGFPFEIDAYDPNQICFKFPIKTSKDAIYKKDVGAVDHLKLWLDYQMYFTEHKPSVTISVKESEWLQVGSWCYDNFEWLSGCAFLPADEGSTVYKQMPFTECTEEEYNELLSKMPENIDWTQLNEFELENSTTNSQDLACVGSVEGCLI